ncbi:hypothetical protein CC78DRAFT_577561 [Lojkania enalia]|uniref:C2H2-type domain-containing protein n=1 Tax=Lojkania enalia TaxID=147567 RepID=A0A9P4N658_9PLEO|nr:hypothetical protein CC78DRAFT_577561 [Didymosphaeria enalia]
MRKRERTQSRNFKHHNTIEKTPYNTSLLVTIGHQGPPISNARVRDYMQQSSFNPSAPSCSDRDPLGEGSSPFLSENGPTETRAFPGERYSYRDPINLWVGGHGDGTSAHQGLRYVSLPKFQTPVENIPHHPSAASRGLRKEYRRNVRPKHNQSQQRDEGQQAFSNGLEESTARWERRESERLSYSLDKSNISTQTRGGTGFKTDMAMIQTGFPETYLDQRYAGTLSRAMPGGGDPSSFETSAPFQSFPRQAVEASSSLRNEKQNGVSIIEDSQRLMIASPSASSSGKSSSSASYVGVRSPYWRKEKDVPAAPWSNCLNDGPASPNVNALGQIEQGGQDDIPDILKCPISDCTAEFRGVYRKGNLARHRKHLHGGSNGTRLNLLCEEPGCTKTFRRQDSRLKHYRKKHSHLSGGPAVPRK